MNNPLIHIQTIIQENETTIDLRKKYGPSKLLKILSLKLLLPLLINRTSLSRTLLKAADNRIYLKVFDLHIYAGCSGQKWTYMWIFLFDGPCFSWQKTRVVVENFKVGGNKQRVKWIRDRGKRNGKVICCYFSFSHSLRSFLVPRNRAFKCCGWCDHRKHHKKYWEDTEQRPRHNKPKIAGLRNANKSWIATGTLHFTR